MACNRISEYLESVVNTIHNQVMYWKSLDEEAVLLNPLLNTNDSFLQQYEENRGIAEDLAKLLEISNASANIFGEEVEFDVSFRDESEAAKKILAYKDAYMFDKICELDAVGADESFHEKVRDIYDFFKIDHHGFKHKRDVGAMAGVAYDNSRKLGPCKDCDKEAQIIAGLWHDEGRTLCPLDIFVDADPIGYYQNHQEAGFEMWHAVSKEYIDRDIIDEHGARVIGECILYHGDSYPHLKKYYHGAFLRPIERVKFGDRLTKLGTMGTMGSFEFALNHSPIVYAPKTMSNILRQRMKRMTDFTKNSLHLRRDVKELYKKTKEEEKKIISSFDNMGDPPCNVSFFPMSEAIIYPAPLAVSGLINGARVIQLASRRSTSKGNTRGLNR